MHQIISGETPRKTKVLNYSKFKDFLSYQKHIFSNFEENCLYDSTDFLKSQSLNYFNFLEQKPEFQTLKNIIRQEYHSLEKLYPFLGDIFLLDLLGDIPIKKRYKCFKFKKSYKNKFIKSLNYKINKEIFQIFLDNFSIEYFLKVEFRKNIDNVFISREDNNNFNLYFEKEY